MHGFFSGFTLGLGLILAIGAQNAFILKQGLKRQYVFVLCLLCALSDALLILAGVLGFAVLVQTFPWVLTAARYGGAAFLTLYGLKSLHAAWRGQSGLQPQGTEQSLLQAVLTCLAFTWLNPHVYLDTMVLIGGISTQYVGEKVAFASGAMLASFCFFFALGYGARLLSPLFRKPASWRVLDTLIAIVMGTLAWQLVMGA